MHIIKATYGGVDITTKLNSRIVNNSIYVKSSNSLCGDPQLGVVKYLEVDAIVNGESIHKRVREGDLLHLTENKATNRLGIFYADNNDERVRSTVIRSLEEIKKSSDGKVDILTNLWQHEPQNPFYEFISWTKTRSHLNQVLQILELLFFAKQTKYYKYVSFLESDVLYPEGYFDYPEFNEDAICNMNYRGLCKHGFQERNQHDKPHSQLTMKFEKAIEHFMSILPNALVNNAGLVEPQQEIATWLCDNTSLHVNHGRHFTSHYSIYSTTNTYEHDQYWGNYKQYSYLFDGMNK